MKTTTSFLTMICVALPAGIWLAAGFAAEEKPASGKKPAYTGAAACNECHAAEYKTWTGSRHGRAFVMLQTAMARKIAADPDAYAGIPGAKMVKECSPCHAPGMEIPKAERGSFHPEDGVQCETCHGPGGHYANEDTMKDPGRRADAGLRKPTQERCLECHKERPSHAILGKGPFEFEKYFAKIQHGKHGEKKP